MLNDKDNEQLAHRLTQLLIDNPEQWLIEMLSLIQAKAMWEVMSRLRTTMEIQLAKLDERIMNFGKGDNLGK